MNRLASQLSLILAALAVTPAALAGSDILKCVDPAGHVTLTDQPCESNARVTRLAGPSALNAASGTSYGASGSAGATGSGSGAEAPAASPEQVHPLASAGRPVQIYAADPSMSRQHDWRPRVPQRDRPLARDVATLKAARAQLMLIDGDRQPRPQLATLQ